MQNRVIWKGHYIFRSSFILCFGKMYLWYGTPKATTFKGGLEINLLWMDLHRSASEDIPLDLHKYLGTASIKSDARWATERHEPEVLCVASYQFRGSLSVCDFQWIKHTCISDNHTFWSIWFGWFIKNAIVPEIPANEITFWAARAVWPL